MTSVAICYLNLKYRIQTLSRQKNPRIFVNSIPKSGTNLIVSLAIAYGRMRLSGPVIAERAGSRVLAGGKGLIFGHVEEFSSSPEEMGLEAGFLLVRRPTAYVTSLARYICVNARHPAHASLADVKTNELLRAVIEGMQGRAFHLDPVHLRYDRYIDNARIQGFHIIDFDRLLAGPKADSPEATLLTYLGGPDYDQKLDAALVRSRETSSTYQHSRRSERRIELVDELLEHPNLVKANTSYEAALHS